MIRYSSLQAFHQGVDGMLNAQKKTFNTQAQIASGKRIATAADDPVAAARIVKIDQEQSQTRQYITNADALENRLTLEESQLKGVTNLLARVREQTVYAANGVLTQSERQSIAIELKGRLTELGNLANTRDSNGEYIFAGFQGGSPAFSQDGRGDYNYEGDDGQRLVNIATSTKIASSDSGKDIFVDVQSQQSMFFNEARSTNSGGAIIGDGEVVDTELFADSDPGGYTVSFDDDASGVPPAPFYTVIGNTDGSSSTVPVIGGSTTLSLQGWSVTIQGIPAKGDSFALNSSSSPKQSMMDTMTKLIFGLENLTDDPSDDDSLRLLMAESLDNLGYAEENIFGITAKIGARFNTLETVRSVNQGVELVNQQILSEIQDLDYAEAVSRLSMESFTLEAAQQSYAKISSLSLFSYLR